MPQRAADWHGGCALFASTESRHGKDKGLSIGDPSPEKHQAMYREMVSDTASIVDKLSWDEAANLYRPLMLTFLGEEGITILRAMVHADRRIAMQTLSLLEDIIGPDSTYPLARAAALQHAQAMSMAEQAFETSCVNTTIVSAYLAAVGKPYLIEILSTHACQILKEAREWKAESFTEQALQTAHNILQEMECTVCLLPRGIRALILEVAEATAVRFPGAQLHVVGVLLLARFVCPHVVAPDRFGAVPQKPGVAAQRALILIAKVFEAISRNGMFLKEQAHAASLNRFIEDHQPSLHRFFGEVMCSSSIGAEGKIEMADTLKVEESKRQLTYFHIWLIQNLEAVGSQLSLCENEASKEAFVHLHVLLGDLQTRISRSVP